MVKTLLTAYAGQPTDYGFDNFYGASLAGNVGKLALSAGYMIEDFYVFKEGITATAKNANVKVGGR